MTIAFSGIDGLGYINYLAPVLGLQQAERILLRNRPFGLVAHIALGAVGADLSCAIAWFAGMTDLQKISFGDVLLVSFVPWIISTAVMFWIKGHRTINQTRNKCICYDERDFVNLSFVTPLVVVAASLLFMSIGFYSQAVNHAVTCPPQFGFCALEESLFGDRKGAYPAISVTSLFLNMYGSALMLNLITVCKNRRLSKAQEQKNKVEH